MTGKLALTFAFVAALAGRAAADPTGTLHGTVDSLGKGPFVVYIDQIDVKVPAEDSTNTIGLKNNVFLPRVLPVVAGSNLELRSADPELHHVRAWAQALGRLLFDVEIPPNAPPVVKSLADAGVVRLSCSAHPEMLAYVVVLQNPFFALTARAQREFTIASIPAGSYDVRIWGEKLEPSELNRRYPVEIKPGQVTEVTLGPIRIAKRSKP